MNFRLTAALFGIVFVLGVILLILSWGDDKSGPSDVLMQELAIANVKTENVEAIEFEQPNGKTLLIVRTNKDLNTWEIRKPIVAKADANRILPVITALLKAKPTPYTELTSNPAMHGLDPVTLKVTLRGNDASSTLNLGEVTLGDKGVVFVTTSSQSKRPMAVRRSDLDALFRATGPGSASSLVKWTSDFRDSSVFPSDTRAAGEDVTAVKIELPNKKKELALVRGKAGSWQFTTPAGWGDADIEGDFASSPNTFTGVRRLLGALTSISANQPGDFIDQPKDLKEYGLDAENPDLVKVTLSTRDGQSATVFIGKREAPSAQPPAMPGMPPQPPSGGKVYVRIDGVPGVIHATSGDLSGVNGVVLDPNPLRDRALVNGDRAKVDGVNILLAGQPADKPTKLRRGGVLREWQLYGGSGDPQSAYSVPVERILDVVMARRIIKDFPVGNPANFAAISATVFVWVDGFTPPTDPTKGEPTQRSEPVKIEFGRREGDVIYVRRTAPGLPTNEFTVPAQAKTGADTDTVDTLATVSKTRLDFLNPSLPTFGSESVVRVTVNGVSNYTLARDEKPDLSTREFLWRYTAPEPGRIADAKSLDQILNLIATQQSVTRFVDELPTPEKLTEYGFTPAPRLKLVVGLNSVEKERVFEFGKDTPDPNFIYARVPGKAAVFTLPRLIFDRFVNPDLRDRVVFRSVDAPKVTKIELKGWGDAGFVTELTFEKNKDGSWIATKSPMGFSADTAKINAFAEILAKSRAATFEKGTPEAKHGFGDPKQSLQATLHWPGGAAAVNLGASPDGGLTYYAWSSLLPQTDPVFTIDAGLLKPFKQKPGGFGK